MNDHSTFFNLPAVEDLSALTKENMFKSIVFLEQDITQRNIIKLADIYKLCVITLYTECIVCISYQKK